MPVKGFSRYIRLFRHIQNPAEYFFHKGERRQRALHFITRPNALIFDVPESVYQVFKEIFMADVYEINRLVAAVPAKPLVVDIGANAGFFDILLLSKLKDATIYAYEPLPANIAHLSATIRQNPGIADRIRFHQLAVTGAPQSHIDLFMEATGDSQVVASVFAGFNKNNTTLTRVNCITLTDIFEQNAIDRIDILKMDCEGSEYDIIYHTDPAYIRRIDRMLVEVHDIDGEQCNIRYFSQYLEQLGFALQYEPINEFCYALEAQRVSN